MYAISIFRFLKKIQNGNFQDIDYVKVSLGLEKEVLVKFGSLKLTILMVIMVSEMSICSSCIHNDNYSFRSNFTIM